MNQVQVGQNTFQMPPQDGFSVAHFITVTDVGRSARFTKRSSEAVLAASVGSFFHSESVAIGPFRQILRREQMSASRG
jgi:hypothetical protein